MSLSSQNQTQPSTPSSTIPLILDDKVVNIDRSLFRGQVFFDYGYECLVKRLIESIYIYQSQLCPLSLLAIQEVIPFDILKIKVDDFDFFAKSICEFLHLKLGKQIVFITKYIEDLKPLTIDILEGIVNLCTTYQNQKSLLRFKYIKHNVEIHFVSHLYRFAYTERAEALFKFFLESVQDSKYPEMLKTSIYELVDNCLDN